jgi:RNA polymerase sigma-70 factor (ECF subfamily)
MSVRYTTCPEIEIGPRSPTDDPGERLVALRGGDEAAFLDLVERYTPAMLRLARSFVSDRGTAEEVVQEAWLAVLQGLARFEGRSSLKTWVFQILINRARTRGRRDARSIPFSALAGSETEAAEPAVDPSRFLPASHPTEARHWGLPPRPWPQTPEELLLSGEVRERLAAALAELPQAQRVVLTLRDLEGWTAKEVCNVLDVSETHQRVLLHRGRSRVRRALAAHLARE